MIIEKFVTDFKRDDVVVYKSEANVIGSTYYIKRIIGLPGDHVVLKDGVLMINGIKLNDSRLVGPINGSNDLTLGADEYFVLGDNLSQSSDSRIVGPIKKVNIAGKVGVNFGVI